MRTFLKNKKSHQVFYLVGFLCLAEREGFEPSEELPLHMISNHAPSTTRTPLHVIGQSILYRDLAFLAIGEIFSIFWLTG